MAKSLRLWICLAFLAPLAGCNHAGYWLYLFMPEPTETIEAEFAQLDGHTVAVIVYANDAIQYSYPSASREVAAQVSVELQAQLEDVTTIDPLIIHKYQQQNLHWDTMNKTELGEIFGADYVLFITLLEFSTREQGSLHLFRGRLSAECAIYDVGQHEDDARDWDTSGISVKYPTNGPIGQMSDDDDAIRYRTISRFAQVLVRNFYEHKVPKVS